MSSILCICPKYPPLMDGLSGHTKYLTDELSKHYDVDLLTSVNIPLKQNSIIKIINKVKVWDFFNLRKNFLALNTNYEHIIIQYVPSLYASRGGINFSIIFFFMYLKFWKKHDVSIIFHELYYPLLPNIKAIILHICHKIMLFGAINSAKYRFFSTQFNKEQAKKLTLIKGYNSHLPVGSSINIDNNLPKRTNIKKTYVIFGAYHPSKRYDLILKAFDDCFNDGDTFNLLIIGTTIEDLKKEISLPNLFSQYGQIFDKLEDKEILKIFNRSDFLVSYFSDGLTTRRSSVISALANNLPVISSDSQRTDSIFKNQEPVILLSINESDYIQDLKSFIKEPKVISENSARLFYEKNLSWNKIILLMQKQWNQHDQS